VLIFAVVGWSQETEREGSWGSVSTAPEKLPIAVLSLEGKGIPSQEVEILTERLRSALVQDGRYQVVERSQMEAILAEQGFQQAGCTTNECLVQAGLILGVMQMVGGTVGRIGNSYAIDIRLFDVESSQIIKAVSRNYQGEVDQLLGVMTEIAGELAGEGVRKPQPPSPVGPPQVLLTEEDLKRSVESVAGALALAGQAVGEGVSQAGKAMDSTALLVKKLLTPAPKDPDIERGRRQGRIDAHDYQRKLSWLALPLLSSALVGAAAADQDGVLAASLLAGWVAKKVYAMLEGEPTLPPQLAEKIRGESLTYQENYRKAWVKEVESLRSKRGSTGCILGVTIGLVVNARRNGIPRSGI
jgi:TolB-like protein